MPFKGLDEYDVEPDPPLEANGMFSDGADHPSLENPQPDGGRGREWPYPPGATRCRARAKTRSKAAREYGKLGPTEYYRCRAVSVKGTDRCRFHGGKVKGKTVDDKEVGHKIGGAPLSQNGRYSKRLGRLREAYEAALSSPTLFDLREGLAVLDACVQRMMERHETLDTPEYRRESKRLFQAAQYAMSTGDAVEAARSMNQLGRLLDEGANEDEATKNLVSTVDALQRRVEEAWKIKLKQEDTMATRDLVVVLGRVAEVVLDEAGGDLGMKILGRIDLLIRGFGAALPSTSTAPRS